MVFMVVFWHYLFVFCFISWLYRIRPSAVHHPWKRVEDQGHLTNRFDETEPNPAQVCGDRDVSRFNSQILFNDLLDIGLSVFDSITSFQRLDSLFHRIPWK